MANADRAGTAPRTLLFDLDGTLTDNFTGIARSILHALRELGEPEPALSELRACVGPPLRGSFARILGTDDSATVERALAAYRVRYAALGWRENRLYAGVNEAIAAFAAAGDRLVLCTSKPQPFAEKIVDHFGLRPHFDAIHGTDLAGRLDDKSALMAHLLARESIEAGDAVMIGDREHDIHAARRNGVRSVGVLWGYGSKEELTVAGADALCGAPEQLAEALASLGS